jgi:hypothetical protein
MVPPDRILEVWTRLQASFDDRRRRGGAGYLGTQPKRLWSVDAASDLFIDPMLAVSTRELALDMPRLRLCVREGLSRTDRLELLFGHDVRGVARTAAGFRLDGMRVDGGIWHREADLVVNCLWEGRLAIDRQLGLVPARPWVYRLKYRLLGRLPARLGALPSLTLVLGRFGDLVNYGGGRVYLSWYSTCLRGWSSDVEVPAAWHQVCNGHVPMDERRSVVRETLQAFDAVVPGLAECQIDSVSAGVIFSWGQTDIDDPESELHRRHDVGPVAHDGYITVNTGKLTSAPLFARRVVDLVA